MIAIDLGSNTIRFVEYDCNTKTWGNSYEAIVKTADGLSCTNKIKDEAIERIINAIKHAKEKLDFQNNQVFAVATAAMRLADNAADALAKIKSQTGISFDIISGGDEAKYTVYAVQKRLNALHIKTKTFVLVDIGGGSTEITFIDNNNITTDSFNVGIVTLTQQAANSGGLGNLLDNVLKDIKLFVQTYYKKNAQPELFVQTAGTPTTLAAYLQGMRYDTYNPAKINGFILKQNVLKQTKKELLAMDKQIRAKYVGIGREDLIITGIDIVNQIYDILGFKDAIVIDDSLREGLAFYYCDKLRLLLI